MQQTPSELYLKLLGETARISWAELQPFFARGVLLQVTAGEDLVAVAEALAAASEQGLLASTHDLSEGGLAQALVESCLRFGIGARAWLGEIRERDGVDQTAALFSESTARVIVSVGREDDVKFMGLCEARGIPVLRIGVTDDSGELQIQDVADFQLAELRAAWSATLPELFG